MKVRIDACNSTIMFAVLVSTLNSTFTTLKNLFWLGLEYRGIDDEIRVDRRILFLT